MPKVELGEFAFDPVEPNDFRMSVEGASGTGKSNTLAVILEDLADTNIPTLIIERLGILTPVRREDPNLITVGGRDEQGIDVVIPLNQVEKAAEMVIDQGLKVLVDLGTYADAGDDPDGHPKHRATARVVRRLNQRAGERLRSGNRRKVILFIDELHTLAPENGAPHVRVDDDVKRSRGQIVNVATEGGNKGINLIGAFQRRAYTTKGVVSQFDNTVVHRLEKGDQSYAADDLGVSEDEIEALETGEILAYGTVTKQRVIGPTKVRRRRSPDPREGGFELPDPPEDLKDTLREIQDSIQADVSEDQRRRDRIEELESEVERKQNRIEELESRKEHVTKLLDELQEARERGEVPEDLEGDVERIEDLERERDELESELTAVREERDELRGHVTTLESEVEDLEAELSEYQDLERRMDEIESSARSILRMIGVDPDAEAARERVQELREELEEREDELREVRDRLQDARTAGTEFDVESRLDSYREFLEYTDSDGREVVKDQIRDAKSEERVSPGYVDTIIANIIRAGGPVSYSELQEIQGVKTTTDISKAVTALENRNIVSKEKRDGETEVDLNTDGISEIIEAARNREKTEEIIGELDL